MYIICGVHIAQAVKFKQPNRVLFMVIAFERCVHAFQGNCSIASLNTCFAVRIQRGVVF
jgi:hypothetical protein